MKLGCHPTDCRFYNGTCRRHRPTRLLQIFSFKLAELIIFKGPVELYGYIAVRDHMDPLLNYIVNISRDGPIIVKQVQTHTYLQLFQVKSQILVFVYIILPSIEPGIRPLEVFILYNHPWLNTTTWEITPKRTSCIFLRFF